MEAEEAGLRAFPTGRPRRQTTPEFLVGHLDVDLATLDVEGDGVTFDYRSQWTAHRCLGRNVEHDRAERSPDHPRVGDTNEVADAA